MDRTLGLGRGLLRVEGHEQPLAYSGRVPVTEVLPVAHETLPPNEVDLDKWEPEPERVRVTAALWRLTAECSIEHQLPSQELMAWRNRTEALKRGQPTIDKKQAEALAIELIGEDGLPQGAVGPDAFTIGDLPTEQAHEVAWCHFDPEQVMVDGDKLLARYNASTGKPYTVFRKWRHVPTEMDA